jgi:putative intracellular protease/amidase
MKENRMADLADFRVAVVATDGFEESELTEPVAALRGVGASVTIFSLEPGQIQACATIWTRPCGSRSTARSATFAPTNSTRCTCPVVL